MDFLSSLLDKKRFSCFVIHSGTGISIAFSVAMAA